MIEISRLGGRSLVAAAIAATLSFPGVARAADDTIKVGILHSLSGTMAISETTLKDDMLMLIDEQNRTGRSSPRRPAS
jgi:urea transport system substrate-binding protein